MVDAVHAIDADNIELEFPAIHIRQPIGDIYVGSVDAATLVKITDFDVRRVIEEERDVERYLGIQRPLDKKRVAQLDKYVNFKDATFPTACILAVEADYADYDGERSKLKIRNFREGDDTPTKSIRYIARVLDGQHRIAGLRAFKEGIFEVPVVFFVGADISTQANIFSTVNLEQNKVGKSLAYDLFALATTRSPQRLAHEIAVAFDADPESPFYRRIKRLGVATPGRYNETISQAQFVEALLEYVSPDPKSDRDLLLRASKIPRPDAKELEKFIFRDMFIGGRDIEIAKSLDGYFQAVRDRWPDAWAAFGRGAVLNKTNGFRALMRLLRPVYHELYGANQVMRRDDVATLLSRSEIMSEQFNTEVYKPGTSGESQLFRDLRDSIGLG